MVVRGVFAASGRGTARAQARGGRGAREARRVAPLPLGRALGLAVLVASRFGRFGGYRAGEMGPSTRGVNKGMDCVYSMHRGLE